MAGQTKTSKRKGRIGQVRCPNCFERFWPPLGADRAFCPACRWEWYISWKGKLAKVRKPVWENWERQLAEAAESQEEGG